MTTLFSGGAENLANDMNVPLLGKIPLDPSIGKACDEGINPFLDETSEKLRNNSAINVYSNIASALKTSLSAMEINWMIDILKYLLIHGHSIWYHHLNNAKIQLKMYTSLFKRV